MQLRDSIKRRGTVVGVALLLSIAAVAQEERSEVSVQGTGFFTKDTEGNGIQERATETGGFLFGYRYNISRWLSAEANYGYDRNTQIYFGGGAARVQSNIHQITGSAIVKLPSFARLQPYALAGGGGLVFDPTGNAGGSFAGTTQVTEGAFVYGVGGDYAFTRHFSLRAEYRGHVYKTPDFNLASLNTNTWTHTAKVKGRVDIVFANAAVVDPVSLTDSTPDAYDKHFNLNARGVYFTVQKALPLLADNGSIILSGSAAWQMGVPNYGPYSGTKAALVCFVRSWTAELASRGIRANVISPGPTETPMIRVGSSKSDDGTEYFRKMIPMGRLGTGDELASAAVFLASDESSFITGIDLAVDGGTVSR